MTPTTVQFTGLTIDPAVLHDRCIKGLIPPDWQRYRFPIVTNVSFPVSKCNNWLRHNIEGRWAILVRFVGQQREIIIAFEHDYDAMTFVMADGKNEALHEYS
jgi:hypothetical protein